jgi:FkbM family methyltransferase
MRETIREIAKEFLPPALYNLLRKLRSLPAERATRQAPDYQMSRTRFMELNRDCPIDEIVLRPELVLRIHQSSRTPFEHFCYISGEMVKEFDAFLELARCRSRLLDIGALHGLFSLAFTYQRPGAQALAVEPSPLAFPTLLYNIHRNPSCNVRPIEVALGGQNGEIPMRPEWEHLRATKPLGNEDSSLMIPLQTGDALCSRENFAPDLIKIDVEGYEQECLTGLESTLRKSRPLLFLEVHPRYMAELGHSPEGLLTCARKHAYTFLTVDRQPVHDDYLRRLIDTTRFILRPNEAPLLASSTAEPYTRVSSTR